VRKFERKDGQNGHRIRKSFDQRPNPGRAACRAQGCRLHQDILREAKRREDRSPALAKAIAKLEVGDVLIVTKIDRLPRSTRDLLNTIHAITAKRAGFKSLGDALIDTTTAHGELMLGILAVLAQFERRLIIDRTSEGRAIAKAKGTHMGRPSKLTLFQRDEAIARLRAGTETVSDIGRSYGVSHATISRLQAAQ
jgi:DNA invertase Pin-like site-specific DNA recombinase